MAPMKKSKCPKGKIYVRGYKTKGSRKRASHRVKGHCVTDKGMPGKTPKEKKILPRLRKGEFGTYSTKKAHPKRMAILKRLVSRLSYSTVLKRLVLLRTYTRRSDPKSAKKYSADIRALQKFHKKHMKAGRKAASKKRSTKKPRVTRKKRTMKRKSTKKVTKKVTKRTKRLSTRKVSKRKSSKRTKRLSTRKVTKRKSAKRTKKAVKRRSTRKMTKRKTTTRRRRVVHRRSTVMNK